MLNNINSLGLTKLAEYAKLLKPYMVYFELDEYSITIYGTSDYMYSLISKIVIPTNVTGMTGTLTLLYTSLLAYVKTLVPYQDLPEGLVDDTVSYYNFINTRDRLNKHLNRPCEQYAIDEVTCNDLKTKILSLRADHNQSWFKLRDKTIITIYAGCFPITKSDVLSVNVLDFGSDYLCKYTVYKKKAPAPIDIFVRYKRL